MEKNETDYKPYQSVQKNHLFAGDLQRQDILDYKRDLFLN